MDIWTFSAHIYAITMENTCICSSIPLASCLAQYLVSDMWHPEFAGHGQARRDLFRLRSSSTMTFSAQRNTTLARFRYALSLEISTPMIYPAQVVSWGDGLTSPISFLVGVAMSLC